MFKLFQHQGKNIFKLSLKLALEHLIFIRNFVWIQLQTQRKKGWCWFTSDTKKRWYRFINEKNVIEDINKGIIPFELS